MQRCTRCKWFSKGWLVKLSLDFCFRQPSLFFPFLFFRFYQQCEMEVLFAKQMKVNTLSEWTHAIHSLETDDTSMQSRQTSCQQREFKNYYTVCYVGTAVLFAGIMKWYLYGSGNREIRILKMDSKSQLTLYRWGLHCTCFQTSTGLEFWISCKGSLRNNVSFPL